MDEARARRVWDAAGLMVPADVAALYESAVLLCSNSFFARAGKDEDWNSDELPSANPVSEGKRQLWSNQSCFSWVARIGWSVDLSPPKSQSES